MRFRFFLILPCVLGLSGCFATSAEYAHHQAVAMCGGPETPSKTAWMFYDECSKTATEFLEIAECGRVTRNNDCSKDRACSPEGNAIVAYADRLAESVRTKGITEQKAFQAWENYKAKQEKDYEKMIARANSPAVRECYERAYPQFLQTETQRRSAIDARWANSINTQPPAPRMMNCHPTGVGGNMTCF